METFRPPVAINFSCSNLADTWNRWTQKLKNYLIASEKDKKPDGVKIAILLNLLGDEGTDIFNTFKSENRKSIEKFDDVLEMFTNYCIPRRNVVFERFKFFSCSQQEGQQVDNYLTELKTLASTCDFGDQEEGLIRDRVVLGIRDMSLQERLLRESDLTLKKAAEFLRASEASKHQIESVKSASKVHEIQKNRDKNSKGTASYTKNSASDTVFNCQKCGKEHKKLKCPAYGKICSKCKRKNHFAAVCKTVKKNYRSVNNLENDNSSNSGMNLFIDSVTEQVNNDMLIVNSLDSMWLKKIDVENNMIEFKLDTGAEINVLPLSVHKMLDLKEGFWQVPLDKDSAELCTFNSPFGRYKFNRLPFGICSAPEVFQKKNQKLFGDIKGVEIYFDDLIIAGKNKEEHDKILVEVLERAKENNIKFNPNKFQFRIEEVKYMGLLVSKDGIKADPSHVKAINEIEKSTSKNDIKRLLGMVNFLSKFIPNVSAVTSPLRVLLKKDIEFQWNHEQETSFEEIKRLISSTPVLKVFNDSLPITIQCDSSKDGLGAYLLQEGHPVSFASRSLTDCEKNYAQIEKELLAIVFSFEKYHNLVLLIESDHQPLTSIVQKPIGSQMYLADTLSRAGMKETGGDDPEMLNVVHSVSKLLPMSESRFKQFQKAT
ncbi:Retrovirus-related Pol polyprotein from transposon 17.6 [Araneus ventricosus]|uniref:Retrovirus-related Pol polyprotein from transposon 17.6 n=1 Tax=Araneus ventricosus TaxID=182803 RepID=A0A4Y2B1P6_ARAVE|nr:Retrovirus-related Pol polyprotein from transposon 17.6 [Araneus ventricosus]